MSERDVIDPSLSLSPASFRRLAGYITGELGIKINETKVAMLQSRPIRRVRTLELQSLDQYLEYVFDSAAGQSELVHFIDAITTNKTDFFREPEHFRYLTQILQGGGTGRQRRAADAFRVWCAGCSSGEEAYTLAMVLEEHAATAAEFTWSILATDISSRVLKHAETAIYASTRIEPIPAPLREKYLLRSREPARQVVRIVPALRRRITFERLNFMDRCYPMRQTFDAIFFRNVMIYFDKPTQEAVINKLCGKLVPGGHLFVGHSESLAGLNVPVRQIGPAIFRAV